MTPFCTYDSTGRIWSYGACDSSVLEHQAGVGRFALPTSGQVDPATQYVVAGAIVQRPASLIEGSVAQQTITLTNVPAGAVVRSDGPVSRTYLVSSSPDGIVVLGPLEPGRHVVVVDQFPRQDFRRQFVIAP